MSFFIIIVSYNGMSWLRRSLDSCATYPIIVVDNASSDETVSFIEINYPEVKLLKQTINLGFGQANNIGIRYALDRGVEHVFLLNQDAYLRKSCIETLLAVQKENPHYGILSPIHLNGSGNRLDSKFSNYVSYKRNPSFYSDFVLGSKLREVYEVPFVNAAGWLLSKNILETIGGFDPLFHHYGEDDNYCQRASYYDFKIGVVPMAFMNHDREDRIVPEYKRGSINYFHRMESSLKSRFANINLSSMESFQELKRRRIKSKLKAYIRLDFQEVLYLKKEISLIQKLKFEIEASRVRNQVRGSHYL